MNADGNIVQETDDRNFLEQWLQKLDFQSRVVKHHKSNDDERDLRKGTMAGQREMAVRKTSADVRSRDKGGNL